MDYQQAQQYILSFTDYEKIPGAYAAANFDLRRMVALLKPLSHPQDAFTSVQVAGTKGKGSTAAMIASALQQAGYRTGLYTSPHLHTIRERLRVDGELISPPQFTALTARVKEVVHPNDLGAPSTFELLTAIAFLHFRERKCQFAVLEAGLGGRLDATNVVAPAVSVITSISYDHTEVLGNTLSQIAWEKAGIIKPGVPAVSSPQDPEAMAVLREVSRERGSPLTVVGDEVTYQKLSADPSVQRLRVWGRRRSYETTIPLLGEHQLENAATAVAALEWLEDKAPHLTPQAISLGLERVSWAGRLQVVARRPWLVLDGAHNADSARRLRESLGLFPHQAVTLIMGTSRDKDSAGMVRELAPLRPRVILTAARHPRATPPEPLRQEWAKYGISPEVAPTVGEALSRAKALSSAEDLILVMGSLFIVAEALEEMGLGRRESF